MQLAECPPSIHSPEQSTTLSTKYGFLNTSEMVQTFFDNGFDLVSAQARQTRKKDPRTTKHLLRFRVKDQVSINGVYPEIIYMNSHDGTSCASFFSGIFRLVCINGIILCDAMLAPSIVIRHTHLNVQLARDYSEKMMQNSLKITHYIPKLADIQMSSTMLDSYAQRASEFLPAPIMPEELLHIRREEDRLPNMWIVYNRVQENLMRGGMRITRQDVQSRRRTRTRPITNIEKNVNINSKLWQLTIDMAENHETHVRKLEEEVH